MELAPQQAGFHLAEFQALKSEAAAAVSAAAAHLRWAAVASGLLLAWLSTEGQDFEIPAMMFFAPAAITLLLGGLSAVLSARVALIGRYLSEIENTLGLFGLGWEKKFAKRKRLLFGLQAAAWIVLLAADLYAGVALMAALSDNQQYETRQASTT